MSFEFTDRIQSSIIIIGLFLFCFFVHKYLFYGLIFFCCFWSWIEWLSIFKKIKNNNTFIIYFSKIISFIYLIYAGLFVVSLYDADKYIFLIFLMVCIFSDIGGYITGKTIGGNKNKS